MADDVEVIAELALYRLDRKLTFDALAEAMTQAGFPMAMRTLHQVLAGRVEEPRETTLHQMRLFVEHERAHGRLPWPRTPAEASR